MGQCADSPSLRGCAAVNNHQLHFSSGLLNLAREETLLWPPVVSLQLSLELCEALLSPELHVLLYS